LLEKTVMPRAKRALAESDANSAPAKRSKKADKANTPTAPVEQQQVVDLTTNEPEEEAAPRPKKTKGKASKKNVAKETATTAETADAVEKDPKPKKNVVSLPIP
jgi:hypothetical protein